MQDRRDYGRGYSLWLMPESGISGRAQEVINKIAERWGCPAFEPHVTLLGHILGEEEKIIESAQEVAREIGQFEADFVWAGGTDRYFKCVFVKVERSRELERANELALKRFRMKAEEEYMPHMSLAYGEMEEQRRKEIMSSLPDLSGRYAFDRLVVCRSTGKVSDWKYIADFRLWR